MKQIDILLGDLKKPREICSIMQNVKWYTYTFCHVNYGIINHGKATDNEWKQGTWGNRIYRKSAGIPGWPDPFTCKASDDMAALLKKYLPDVMKNDVAIIVNDYTQDLIQSGSTLYEIENFILNEEDRLVKEYIKTYGNMPILNRKPTYSKPKPIFDSLFCCAA